jgi:putative ABC transport system permease protein
MQIEDISILALSSYYALLIIPFGMMVWLRIPVMGKTVVAVSRMTLQLLFVGFYLQIVFRLNNPWINSLWLGVMLVVADLSIIRGCGLKLRRFVFPLFIALVGGTAIPLLAFVGPLLNRPGLMDAQYVIPIGGMILGNCLRADIIGIRSFYEALKKREKMFLYALSQGARLHEAIRPFLRDSVREVKAKFPIAHLGMKVGVSGCFLIRTGAGEILISFGWRAFSSFLDAA